MAKGTAHSRQIKWIRWLILLLSAAVVCFVGFLANPHVLMSHRLDLGNLSFYSDREIGGDLAETVNCVFEQIRATGIFDGDHATEIYLCQEPALYKLFARMCFIPAQVPAYNLSLLNVSFVSMRRIEQIRENNRSNPKYSVFEGNPCHGIAHELIHDYMVEKIGYMRNRSLPRWKREGYAEYHASCRRLESENVESLMDRVGLIRDAAGLPEHILEYYSWRTVTEYLFKVEGYDLDGYLQDSVSYEKARIAMFSWYDAMMI